MLLILEFLLIVILAMILYMLYTNQGMAGKKIIPHLKAIGYWGGKERREHVRFKKGLLFTYVVEKKPHLTKNGKIVDISCGGIKIISDEKFPEGAILDLKLDLPNPGVAIELEGKVVWTQDAEENDAEGKRLFFSGIQFLYTRGPIGNNLANYIRSLAEELKA